MTWGNSRSQQAIHQPGALYLLDSRKPKARLLQIIIALTPPRVLTLLGSPFFPRFKVSRTAGCDPKHLWCAA